MIHEFLKNLVFVIFLQCFILLPIGIYYTLLTSKTSSGLILTISSIILGTICLTIAAFYHKRNIHINNYGTTIGLIMLIASAILEVAFFSWPTDFLLILISVLLLAIFFYISRKISKRKTTIGRS